MKVQQVVAPVSEIIERLFGDNFLQDTNLVEKIDCRLPLPTDRVDWIKKDELAIGEIETLEVDL